MIVHCVYDQLVRVGDLKPHPKNPNTHSAAQVAAVIEGNGWRGPITLTSAELYDPASDRWTLTGSMATGRLQHAARLLANGEVLIAGGRVASGDYSTPTATAGLYDPATGEFTPTGSMTRPRAVFTATLLLDETVLVADYGETDLYDPATGRFAATAPLPPDIDAITAVRLLDGRVLATGGSGGSTTASQIYVPSTRTWQAAASLNWSRYYAPWGAALLDDGRVLVVGGTARGRDLSVLPGAFDAVAKMLKP